MAPPSGALKNRRRDRISESWSSQAVTRYKIRSGAGHPRTVLNHVSCNEGAKLRFNYLLHFQQRGLRRVAVIVALPQ